jgi:hypothetical protein
MSSSVLFLNRRLVVPLQRNLLPRFTGHVVHVRADFDYILPNLENESGPPSPGRIKQQPQQLRRVLLVISARSLIWTQY